MGRYGDVRWIGMMGLEVLLSTLANWFQGLWDSNIQYCINNGSGMLNPLLQLVWGFKNFLPGYLIFCLNNRTNIWRSVSTFSYVFRVKVMMFYSESYVLKSGCTITSLNPSMWVWRGWRRENMHPSRQKLASQLKRSFWQCFRTSTFCSLTSSKEHQTINAAY